jgi:hypothetical protein
MVVIVIDGLIGAVIGGWWLGWRLIGVVAIRRTLLTNS